jgi:hypothetical protein
MFRRLLGTKRIGTDLASMHAAARLFDRTATLIHGPYGIDAALNFLDEHGIIMCGYSHKAAHIVTIVKQGKRYLITNVSRKEGHVSATRRALEKFISTSQMPPVFILAKTPEFLLD